MPDVVFIQDQLQLALALPERELGTALEFLNENFVVELRPWNHEWICRVDGRNHQGRTPTQAVAAAVDYVLAEFTKR